MPSPSLAINHNVYILGAGFSVEAGVPAVRNFLHSMERSLDTLSTLHWDEEVKSVTDVLNLRHSAAAACHRVMFDPDNIEDLFSLATAGNITGNDESIRRAIAATIRTSEGTGTLSTDGNLCFGSDVVTGLFCNSVPPHWRSKEVARLHRFELPKYEIYAGFLSSLWAPTARRDENTIISFNYDMVLERALAPWGVTIDYGFGQLKPKGAPPTLNVSHRIANTQLRLYKLHGSVNWTFQDPRGDAIAIHDSYDDARSVGAPAIIPPTWGKKFSTGFAKVWEQARAALANATRIAIMGFSMPETDVHFRYLLGSGLADNICLRDVTFINPDKELIERRVKGVFSPSFVEARRVHVVGERIGYWYPAVAGLEWFGREPDKDVAHWNHT